MGKLLPLPYPGQSMDEYREQLVNFKKTYWSFLKPSKGGSKFIPSPPLTLIKKTKEMSSRKLSEHVEDELFNKEKRATPKVDKDKVIKTTPKIVKESVLGSTEDKPVKKKKPYYRKKYNKPKPVEVIIPEPVRAKNYFIHGLIIGAVVTLILCKLYYTSN
jgi:Uma2 family endonuclease